MRILAAFAMLLLAAALPAGPARAQGQGQPPHAFLFGTWTGGFFAVPPGLSREACFSQPVVIFTRDLAMRATLAQQTLTQREIETARVVPGGFEFRFLASPAADSSLLGLGGGRLVGFGCENADVLHVQRRGENEISFPGCPEFPNPLVRCR